ncbi:hypothetical protein B0H11DRAFT_2259908 [Mycena galericulata]|nr:hypothetical protein B0H11DRAFT_2259908 [Mycena galericulata]
MDTLMLVATNHADAHEVGRYEDNDNTNVTALIFLFWFQHPDMSRRVNTQNLAGSSLTNPWELDDRGGLVLANATQGLHINTAPSTLGGLVRTTRSIRTARVNVLETARLDYEALSSRAPVWASRASLMLDAPGELSRQRVRARRIERERMEAAARAPAAAVVPAFRLRPHPAAPSIRELGQRAEREEALTEEALYLDGARPPAGQPKPYHRCTICTGVKSHPVSFTCGHSNCYVCIRLWLELKWTCPECVTVIKSAPFRHYGEEASIANDYPDWDDQSKVAYNWDGLVFPRPRRVIAPDTP